MIARLPSQVNMQERIISTGDNEPFDQEHFKKVQERCANLNLDDGQLKDIMGRLEQSFSEGLHPDTASKAAVKMLPAFIRATSVGEERGRYLALDLGGSKFRVLMIDLNGRNTTIEHSTYELPDEVQKGTGKQLLDHIVHCMAKFMEEKKLIGQGHFPLGFTFSFPCRQESLTSARLISWTKGFNASDVVGKDVVKLLRETCKRKKINTDVVAVLNDTTGTMLACSFFHENCYVGLIVGTGTNACYMEKLANIPKLKDIVNPEEDGLPDEMCINCEWGAFGDDGRLEDYRTKYDRDLDEQTINPSRQLFEKMISGMYLGELVRLVLLDLIAKEILFREQPDDAKKQLSEPDSFSTRLVSEVERQVRDVGGAPLTRIGEILDKEIGIQESSTTDCAIVCYVCSLLSSRAAHMVAVGIAAILKRMNRPSVTVGVDGTLYRVHPTFKDLLAIKIGVLTDGKYDFNLVLSEDGSGRGAAVAAAVATRMEQLRAADNNTGSEGTGTGSNNSSSTDVKALYEERPARANSGCRPS